MHCAEFNADRTKYLASSIRAQLIFSQKEGLEFMVFVQIK
jgi:hypothetical protein